MFELILILGIYTAIILFFVPLTKIGLAQEHVQKQIKRLIGKLKS